MAEAGAFAPGEEAEGAGPIQPGEEMASEAKHSLPVPKGPEPVALVGDMGGERATAVMN